MALISPQCHLSEDHRPYLGSELRSHWIFETFGIQGDALVAFQGPADVKITSMVDMADRRDGLSIAADSMLHFLLESFGPDLDRAVFLQKLLVMLAFEAIQPLAKDEIRRDGDDIFVNGGKLSVSIATVSRVSSLVHFGINVTNEGTPVKTASLSDLGVDWKEFASKLMNSFAVEIDSMARATTKVRGVE